MHLYQPPDVLDDILGCLSSFEGPRSNDWHLGQFLLKEDGLLSFFEPIYLSVTQKQSAVTQPDSGIPEPATPSHFNQTPNTQGILMHDDQYERFLQCNPNQDSENGHLSVEPTQPSPQIESVPILKKTEPIHQRPPRTCRTKRKCLNMYPSLDNYFDDDSSNRRSPSSNETKNIPKNYGKAILSFIERNREQVIGLLSSVDVPFEQFVEEFRQRKKHINTIADLRSMWVEGPYCKELRILSNLFLRKHSYRYIFNSRITNFASHIKYRKKLQEALLRPQLFNNIKDY